MSGVAESSQTSPPAVAIPSWITPALIAQTCRAWRPYFDHDLSDDEAVGILIPMGALIDVLLAENPLDKNDVHGPPAP